MTASTPFIAFQMHCGSFGFPSRLKNHPVPPGEASCSSSKAAELFP